MRDSAQILGIDLFRLASYTSRCFPFSTIGSFMADKIRAWSPPQIIFTAIFTVFAWSAIGFSWFGPGFHWKTQGAARQISEAAVQQELAAICVAQARASVDSARTLEELKALSSWKRPAFVAEAGWANMPGSDTAANGVADSCAAELAES